MEHFYVRNNYLTSDGDLSLVEFEYFGSYSCAYEAYLVFAVCGEYDSGSCLYSEAEVHSYISSYENCIVV